MPHAILFLIPQKVWSDLGVFGQICLKLLIRTSVTQKVTCIPLKVWSDFWSRVTIGQYHDDPD